MEYRELKRQLKSQGVHTSHAKYNDSKPQNVPEDHRARFNDVQNLGRFRFDSYNHVPHPDTPLKPWTSETKRRATRILTYALLCRRENRNEDGWRHEVEDRVLERFDMEVACKKCRKRLWRSEIEAHDTSSSSLEERRQNREPCTCNPSSRAMDYNDPGVSDLFSKRIGEVVHDATATDNPKKRPDRLHGLQKTSEFERLLQRPYVHDTEPCLLGRSVEEVVRISVNPDNGGDPLMFPFLVLEAKGEKGTEGFEHMEVQSGFPIRSALSLQYDLLKRRGNTIDVPGGPIVWYLANRGEDWRVYAATVREEDSKTTFRLHYLWGGSITGIDEALQLILIVDYITDWARDIYRQSILSQLAMLSGTTPINDAATVIDPLNRDFNNRMASWVEADEQDGPVGHQEIDGGFEETSHHDAVMPTSPTVGPDLSSLLQEFDSPYGVIRNARTAQSHLEGVFINKDNVEILMKAFENDDCYAEFARAFIYQLDEQCIILNSSYTLDTIEQRWTGKVRSESIRDDMDVRIFAQFRISYYMNERWDRVRKLTYIAVTDAALSLMSKFVGSPPNTASIYSSSSCSRPFIVSRIDEQLQRPFLEEFVSSLMREEYRIDVQRVPVIKIDDSGYARETFALRAKVTPHALEGGGVTTEHIVREVLCCFASVRVDSTHEILRMSERTDYDARLQPAQASGATHAPLQQSSRLVVYGGRSESGWDRRRTPQLCIYVTNSEVANFDRNAFIQDLSDCLSEDIVVCRTIRRSKTVPRTQSEDAGQVVPYAFISDNIETKIRVKPKILREYIGDWIKWLDSDEKACEFRYYIPDY